ncbi:hypothetical protein Bhyg_03019 [Pseudolycoriella hygida]|uniref:Uncharacterized protein n=1 Tax=Pseudolycoriella hygida TaxID=35572 RepID=A0A9Q0NDQ5_9DIPT|nr:hypothetical protein Bhyg_03019 [Pseudolycoriella hygida]
MCRLKGSDKDAILQLVDL